MTTTNWRGQIEKVLGLTFKRQTDRKEDEILAEDLQTLYDNKIKPLLVNPVEGLLSSAHQQWVSEVVGKVEYDLQTLDDYEGKKMIYLDAAIEMIKGNSNE